MKIRKILLLSILILVVISLPSFLEHVYWFASGQVRSMVIQNRWDLVAINIAIFLAFLIPLNFRKRVDWKSMGIYTAFIVSLFAQMYGFPFAIYLISSPFISSPEPGSSQTILLSFSILGAQLNMTFWKIVGAAISIIGAVFIIIGWYDLYQNLKKNELVTTGIYAYSRHPQYLGIMLITIGWFVHWPSLVVLIMLPILLYFYYKLAIQEEKEVMDSLDDPDEYLEYKKAVPRFI